MRQCTRAVLGQVIYSELRTIMRRSSERKSLSFLPDGLPEIVACPLSDLWQQRLEISECMFDGILVAAVIDDC